MRKSTKQELLKQQRIWYKKLEESGFIDLETFSEDFIEPASNTIRRSAKSHHMKLQSRTGDCLTLEEFYRKARRLHWTYMWDCEVEKAVWGFYIEGHSQRQILKLIPDLTYYRVNKIIAKLSDIALNEEKYQLTDEEREEKQIGVLHV